MVFVCRPSMLLVSLSMLACGTKVVQAEDLYVGDTIVLESAPKGVPSGLFVKAGTSTGKDYTLVGKDDRDQFTLSSEDYYGEVRSRGRVRLQFTDDDTYMSCKPNGFMKGDKCRTRTRCEGAEPGPHKYCWAEELQLLIDPGGSSRMLRNGDMVQFKNQQVEECVNNRGDSKVDLDRCNKDSARTYWKVHKV